MSGWWLEMIVEMLSGVAIETWAIIGSLVALSVLVVELGRILVNDTIVSWFSESESLQPVVGAVLGLIPGCGGAIAVMPLYGRGAVGFGTVVATLAATAGDSAFVLLAVAPEVAPIAYGIAFVTAVLSGLLIEKYGTGTARIDRIVRQPATAADGGMATRSGHAACGTARRPASSVATAANLWSWVVLVSWWTIALVGLGVSMRALLTQSEPQLVLWETDVIAAVGVAGIALSGYVYARGTAPATDRTGLYRFMSALWRSAASTSRIVLWVAVALLAFELATMADVQFAQLPTAGMLAPIGGALIGALPGCGVHVGIATAYGEGAIPFSALLANAISQDGDAFFPLLAIDYRAAIVATIYTVIPAAVAGGAVHILWQLFDLPQFWFALAG
ncbi:hypothetical protein C476_00672 [Natrinema limicola JCM 13563]|uniref:Permease n=2 Tax=Natrinema limicola TaxID=370323 RepID=M0CVK7_9EURY|nr:hypothetical protein C476_00672 [Natrinema limicola JCM 13563]